MRRNEYLFNKNATCTSFWGYLLLNAVQYAAKRSAICR